MKKTFWEFVDIISKASQCLWAYLPSFWHFPSGLCDFRQLLSWNCPPAALCISSSRVCFVHRTILVGPRFEIQTPSPTFSVFGRTLWWSRGMVMRWLRWAMASGCLQWGCRTRTIRNSACRWSWLTAHSSEICKLYFSFHQNICPLRPYLWSIPGKTSNFQYSTYYHDRHYTLQLFSGQRHWWDASSYYQDHLYHCCTFHYKI